MLSALYYLCSLFNETKAVVGNSASAEKTSEQKKPPSLLRNRSFLLATNSGFAPRYSPLTTLFPREGRVTTATKPTRKERVLTEHLERVIEELEETKEKLFRMEAVNKRIGEELEETKQRLQAANETITQLRQEERKEAV